MELGLITTLLGGILAGMFSQTIAVWIALGNVKRIISETKATLEKKIDSNKCPFGECPLYSRAKLEAVQDRDLRDAK